MSRTTALTSPSTTAAAPRRCGWSGRRSEGEKGRVCIFKGGLRMETRQAHAQQANGVSRRALLKAGLAAGATLSTWPLWSPPVLWGADAGQPRRGGVLRVRGWDPPHFDPHLTISNYTHSTL